jgi:hypothetical protein
MIENIDTGQEPKENPINNTSEKPSEENISSVETDKKNAKQQTEIMETHAHHLHHAPGEKAWHYFYEFLMLFLAVSCGFMAENYREHMVENQKAKQFAYSLLTDLKEDTVALKAAIAFGMVKINAIDSLCAQLDMPRKKWKDTLVYKYSGLAARVKPFETNSGTYEQLKASGSLRYFKQELADLLNNYAVQSKKAETRENICVKYMADYYNPLQLRILEIRSVIQIQDGIKPSHPLVFRKTDKETIALWINYAAVVQSTQGRTLIEYNIMLKKAEQIIEVLQKEYHL